MLIDWYTVVAQIINFLILIFLLKRFLYGRIISAMDRREERIAERLKEADRIRVKAREEADRYRKENEELERKRAEMMDQAKKEVDARRTELMEKAKKEVEDSRDSWFAAIERERNSFIGAVRMKSIQEVTSLVRRVISDLAGADLEAQIIQSFALRLKELDPEKAERVAAASKEGGLFIRSAFTIPEDKRGMLQGVIADRFGDVSPAYITDEAVGVGVVLEVPGFKLGWNVKEYMNDLDQALTRTMQLQINRRKSSTGQNPEGERRPKADG